jgi:hypothetical protein
MTIYCFTSLFLWYGDVIISCEGLQTLDPCSALRAFEQEGIFIVPDLLWHEASFFLVSSEGLSHLIAFYDSQGDLFEQGGIYIVLHNDLGFPVSFEGPSHLIACYDLQRDAEDLFTSAS